MGAGDLMPIGSHKRKPDPKRAKKIREGGKKADEIRKQANIHHKSVDVPIAEEQLEKDLKKL